EAVHEERDAAENADAELEPADATRINPFGDVDPRRCARRCRLGHLFFPLGRLPQDCREPRILRQYRTRALNSVSRPGGEGPCTPPRRTSCCPPRSPARCLVRAGTRRTSAAATSAKR